MSDQFKIPAFRDRNAAIIQGVPIFDPSKLKVKNNIGQESLGEVYVHRRVSRVWTAFHPKSGDKESYSHAHTRI